LATGGLNGTISRERFESPRAGSPGPAPFRHAIPAITTSTSMRKHSSLAPFGCAIAALVVALPAARAQNNETPGKFAPATATFDYQRRDVMIPMRDGTKLHTVILVPKNARRAPILLTRTPYDATATTTYAQSVHLGPTLTGYDNALDVIVPGGYIRVVQDIRGKYGS
jgi:predicted acyl esterase